ncbi:MULTISPECIES: flagellar basal body rod protein FlgB [Rhodopirellula]|jgi:flagellar basal-body rod protein FlgB|uniref:Flagellar basal-body rod protein FlgB n=1 Tax=Rhodopirellula europaea SH398 TaxID=1263868 RepID=M5S979_9BACT|nr:MULTISPECIES: flagellar biosynthesis protein FlgB [Rhodopirellula]EMI28050.1 flagellar basal-body rod protein FlgB [Rhodopirellula europaea SH398]MCR9209632.1 flagellar biosynthesis protein FlgB [bacterium]
MFNPVASTTIGALEQTLAFTERRHELLAGNIANLSTPDYRSRDLDQGQFQTALAESIRDRGKGPSPAPEIAQPDLSQGHIPSWVHDPFGTAIRGGTVGMPNPSSDQMSPEQLSALTPSHTAESITRDDQFSGPRAAMEQVVFHDNSDVSLEQQVTEIAKNQHLHDLAVTTLRSQFELLRAAITERA